MDKKVMDFVKEAFVLDGCTFMETRFDGCHEVIHNSCLDAFFLTTPGSTEGFTETVRHFGSIYNICDQPETRVKIVKKIEDFQTAKDAGCLGLVFAFQDPKPIENSLDNLRALYELGLRVVQLTYNKATYIGSGCAETHDGGLTDFGHKLVKEMNHLGMVVDLSHCSTKTSLDAIEASDAPVLITHANAKAVTDSPRNHTDEEFKKLAAKGGVVGVCPWGPIAWHPEQHCQPTMDDFVEHFEYMVNLIGIDHVAFGTDYILDEKENKHEKKMIAELYPNIAKAYNEEVGTHSDVRYVKGFKGGPEIANAVEALLSRGYSEDDMRKFLGGNFLRVLKEVWKA